MQKTKLGVSIGLAGSLVYFMALFGAVFSSSFIVPLLLVAGYILIAEDHVWLKRQAAKALGIVIFFALLQLAMHWILVFLQMIQTFVTWGHGDYFMVKPTQVIDIIEDILNYTEGIILLVMAFGALKLKEVRFGVVDGLLNRHMLGMPQMQPQQPMMQQVQGQPQQPMMQQVQGQPQQPMMQQPMQQQQAPAMPQQPQQPTQ